MTEIKIQHFKTGMVEVDKALLYHQESANPIAYTGLFRSSKHRVLIPVSSYLIEHPKGRVLIDTGWSKAVRKEARKHLGYRLFFSKPYLPEGWAIDERLSALGLSEKDIDYLLLSHLDLDHVGGLEHVKNVEKILVNQTEWESAKKDKIRYMSSLWQGVEFTKFKTDTSQIFGKKSLDLFGDDSVHLVETPGHSLGLTSVVVKNSKGEFIVLASDVGYAGDSLEKLKIPGVLADKSAAVSSLVWLKDLSQKNNCKGIYFNHDTNKKDSIIIL
ncbi:N-acyl homoserine lactonase family protein [Gemella cuniculi]|uniref:N-acyl homoserine lactonase family protein n=1 Tax=Gemella cuniculi TaxID=150240 RepID=UPI0004265B3C|nr:N-acyl homoserine lactonase family protein [Gemella cuniculi]